MEFDGNQKALLDAGKKRTTAREVAAIEQEIKSGTRVPPIVG